LQSRYPSTKALTGMSGNSFEASFTDADVSRAEFVPMPRNYTDKLGQLNLIHVSSNLSNNSKGYKELIEVFKMLVDKGKKVKLLLVGGGELSSPLQEYIERNGLRDNITFCGQISKREELFQLLREADIFVFPSYTEGLPRVVVEAMLNALPCIASDIPGNAELLEASALVPVRDSKKLEEKIIEFADSTEVLNYQSKRNLECAYGFSKEYTDKVSDVFYKKLRSCIK
jgi:L-malate glycosyltransferase